MHVRKPVDAGRRLPGIRKQRDRIRERQVRVGGSEDRAGRAVSLVREDHRGCGSALQMSGVLGVGVEGEIAGAGFFNACHAHDVDVAISLELAVEAFGDVPQLQGGQYTTATGGGKPARAIIEGHSGIPESHGTRDRSGPLLRAARACGSAGLRPGSPRRDAADQARLHDDHPARTGCRWCFSKITRRRSSTPRSGITSGRRTSSPGRTGFAHLFEHMMFKGSKNVEPEGHPSWISSIGGQSNAYTTEDATVFWETVPAQYLPLVLWLEADRMATLRIDEKTSSRPSARSSRKSGGCAIDNQPYGRLNELIYDQAFTVHPYKHPTIGSMKDLEAASIDDVRDFFRTYYVPNNATLVLVGDFDTKEAQELVTKYLGRVPKSDRPVPRDIPKEPPQTKERRVKLRGVLAAAGRRRRAPHHVRRRSGFVSAAHRVEGAVRRAELADLPQAGLREAALRWRRSAAATSSRTRTCSTRSRSCSRATRRRRRSTALIAELDRLRNEPITPAELQQAKNQFARDYIFSRESNKDKAMQLGARGRHPQRHQDRRRRVRHLHEHHAGRCSARGAEILHAREPAGA